MQRSIPESEEAKSNVNEEETHSSNAEENKSHYLEMHTDPNIYAHSERSQEMEGDFTFLNQGERFPIFDDPYELDSDEEEIPSETASVLTLYLSQQDNTISPSHKLEEETKERKEEVIRFTPADGVYHNDRVKTAPPRPSTELEELRASKEFINLEVAAIAGSQLIQRSDSKFDLDSLEGQDNCKKFLQELEKLFDSFKVPYASRAYRNKFSQAYKVLYKEGTLSYLTEILDSAQEGFPFLWVNSEKYVFSKDVLKAAENLYSSFCKIKHIIRNIYNRLCEESPHADVRQVITELRLSLESFDQRWATFEQLYVLELMLIESDARKRVVTAIELEKEMRTFEKREKMKGKVVLNCETYNEIRKKFVNVCCQINSVANPEGKGRDDLSVDILIAAEGISRRISNSQSKAVRKLADQIKKSLNDTRELLKKYDANLEQVDPQLGNNPDLVEVLMQFEKSWEKGKEFFLNGKLCNMLINFSRLIEGVTEKYKELQEKIEGIDTEIFVIIPCLVVLNSFDGEDKGICKMYYPPLNEAGPEQYHYESTKNKYEFLKKRSKDGYEFYNMVEQSILEKEPSEHQLKKCKVTEAEVKRLVHDIKRIAMGLQRHKPTEWNSLLEVAMGQI